MVSRNNRKRVGALSVLGRARSRTFQNVLIVITGRNYTLYFTRNAPQNLRYILLNTPATEGITIGSYHAKPNRLDVYVDDTYVVPENGEYQIILPIGLDNLWI